MTLFSEYNVTETIIRIKFHSSSKEITANQFREGIVTSLWNSNEKEILVQTLFEIQVQAIKLFVPLIFKKPNHVSQETNKSKQTKRKITGLKWNMKKIPI